MFSLAEVDQSWRPIFEPHIKEIDSILESFSDKEITPSRELIFRAFTLPISAVKAVILGQDPYPTAGVADGLSFSVSNQVIPASLRNIILEYCDDLGYPKPSSGDLTPWLSSGVLLLNTSLTTEVGERDKHKNLGWQTLISSILMELSKREVVAILWGNTARVYGNFFKAKIESPHPSPLSAHRGFFGSKPFTRSNQLLVNLGRESINWKLP